MKRIDPAAPEAAGDESFLQRLHRRKLAARRGEPLPTEPPTPQVTASEAPGAAEPEVVLTDEDMPPIESLNSESDFSGFLSPGVSEELRCAALRRLWQVADTPFIDDLDVYAADYTQFEPLGGLVTQEMSRRLEMTARREAQRVADDHQAGEPAIDAQTERDRTGLTAQDETSQPVAHAVGSDQEETDAG